VKSYTSGNQIYIRTQRFEKIPPDWRDESEFIELVACSMASAERRSQCNQLCKFFSSSHDGSGGGACGQLENVPVRVVFTDPFVAF
jgi:hypothetical protein